MDRRRGGVRDREDSRRRSAEEVLIAELETQVTLSYYVAPIALIEIIVQ